MISYSMELSTHHHMFLPPHPHIGRIALGGYRLRQPMERHAMQTYTYLPDRRGAHAAQTRKTNIDALRLAAIHLERLKVQGIRSLGDLKDCDPETTSVVVGVPTSRVRQWQAIIDFMEVHGIGKEHGRLLVNCGINGVDDLLRRERQAVLFTVGRLEATKPSDDGGHHVQELAVTSELVDKWFTKAGEVA